LLAEHREIKRIPNTVLSGRAKLDNIPDKFTLGKGHVKFFYNKQLYLFERYLDIHEECRKRGFNVTNFATAWRLSIRTKELWNNYTPTEEDKALIRQRIKERINGTN